MTDHLTRDPLDAASILRAVAAPEHGASVVFAGTVRNQNAGREVVGIEYVAYEAMAQQVLARLETEIGERHGARLRILHGIGELEVGEASVMIAAAAPHRDPAYRACREALERLKREAPIWKRERYSDGSSAWREEEPLGVSVSSEITPAEEAT